jgi:hypothetical protein
MGRYTVSFEVKGIDAASWQLAPVDANPPSVQAKLVPSPRGVKIVLVSNDLAPVEVQHIDLVRLP